MSDAKILLADDEENHCWRIFSLRGFAVDPGGTTLRWPPGRYDAILDVMLPHRSGLDVLRGRAFAGASVDADRARQDILHSASNSGPTTRAKPLRPRGIRPRAC